MKRNITVIIIIIFIIIILIASLSPERWQAKSLVNPGLGLLGKQVQVTPAPIPSSTPLEFKFDAGTDLKKELESVNPQVLDSDFD